MRPGHRVRQFRDHLSGPRLARRARGGACPVAAPSRDGVRRHAVTDQRHALDVVARLRAADLTDP